MKTILITGANSGIGYETAKALALKGNLIIAASRESAATLETFAKLNQLCLQKNSVGKIVFHHLDLADFASVEVFINLVKANYPIIDTLICNAGIMNTPDHLTKDNFERQFQTNFLSHFKITMALFENLLKSENPKVINVCSASAEKGSIHSIPALEEISSIAQESYDGMTSYRESKLAQQVSVLAFSRKEEYQKIKFSLIHPGVVNTNLFYRNSGRAYKALMTPFVYLGYALGFLKTPKQGAETSIFLSETDAYPSGQYWHKQKSIAPNPISLDADYGQALLDWCKEKI